MAAGSLAAAREMWRLGCREAVAKAPPTLAAAASAATLAEARSAYARSGLAGYASTPVPTDALPDLLSHTTKAPPSNGWLATCWNALRSAGQSVVGFVAGIGHKFCALGPLAQAALVAGAVLIVVGSVYYLVTRRQPVAVVAHEPAVGAPAAVAGEQPADAQACASAHRVLECPITQEPITHPAVTPDGHCYEHSAILYWVERNGTDPMTRRPLTVNQIIRVRT